MARNLKETEKSLMTLIIQASMFFLFLGVGFFLRPSLFLGLFLGVVIVLLGPSPV
jgi:hypothetical protein